MSAKRAHRRKHAANQGSQHNIRLSGGESTIEELVEETDTRASVSPIRKSKHARTNSIPNGTAPPPNGAAKSNASAIDWEVPRKALHSSIGFFTLYLYTSNGDRQRVIIALSSAVALLIPIDILRLRYPSLEYAFEKCVGIFMRDSEKKSSNGVIWYILGVNIVLVALPLDIAVVSVLILYGSRTPRLPKRLFGIFPLAPRKSLAGFAAATLTGAVIATGFWTLLAPLREQGLTWTWQGGVSHNFSGGVRGGPGSPPTFAGWVGLLTIGVVAGLVTGIAEALDLGGVDDNLSLPVIAGGCLWGLFKILGWLDGVLA
ncbi:hypothetical protein J3R82DRAFT_7934 [Butyriboletus roseoflavus]|nr:hypothetical protein J3R82DRAFT_7934 [Butyriboletus roseoflavus]